MKKYVVEETLTVTETSVYIIEAESEKEALENFRQEGMNLGSCSTGNPDGVTIRKYEEGEK